MSDVNRKSRSKKRTASRFGVLQILDVRALNILVIVAVSLMFIGYLAVNTRAATKGFTIRSLERKIAELEERNKSLSLDALTGQSMESIEGQVAELGFVPVGQVEYLSGAVPVVARR